MAEDDDWGLLVWTLLVTGARRGEVLALRWENLDLAAGVLTIRHRVSEGRATATVRGTTTIKGTKTHQSRRVSLDATTVALLIDTFSCCARTAISCVVGVLPEFTIDRQARARPQR